MSKHKDKEYSIFEIAMNLTITCLVSGMIIAGTYFFTAPIAAEKSEMMKQQTMQTLIKDADSFKAIPGKEGWFEASKAGNVFAYIVPAEPTGYGGKIRMMVAVSKDGKVIDYNILAANETPGLGDKAAKDFFRQRLIGKSADALIVVKDPAKTENVQALTGATITSRAVTKGVREAVEEVVRYAGGM